MPELGDLSSKVFQGSNNPINMIRDLQTRQADLASSEALINALDDQTADLGDQVQGRFIAPDPTATSSEPTDSGFTGVFASGRGESFGGVNYGIGTVLLGALQAGFGMLGQFFAASGALVANAVGLTLTGLLYLLQFTATNAGNTRTGKFGMLLLPGQTVPSMQWDFESAAGATLVTNGDAETGDLTGWTDSASAWSAYSTSPYAGTYSFRHNPTVLTLPALLTQTVTGLSAGVTYSIAFASKRNFGYLTPKVFLVWKTSGHATIRTDTITGNAGSSWNTSSQNIVSPATTAEVTIQLDNGGGDPFQEFLYDAITFGASGTVVQQTATDAGWQFENPFQLLQVSDPAAPAVGYTEIHAKATGLYYQNNAGGAVRVDGAMDVIDSDTTLTSNSAEQTMYTISVPGNLLGTDGCLELDMWISYFNNSGATRTSVFKLYYGASSVTVDNDSFAVNASYWLLHVKVVLKANGATNAQNAYGHFAFVLGDGNRNAPSVCVFGTNNTVAYTADSTAAQTFKLTWTTAATQANHKMIIHAAQLTYLPAI